MTEPEVSLRLAIYSIKNHLTEQDVKVSIDGAQIKTGKALHFDIKGFLSENHCEKTDGDFDRWQGQYCITGQKDKNHYRIHSGIWRRSNPPAKRENFVCGK